MNEDLQREIYLSWKRARKSGLSDEEIYNEILNDAGKGNQGSEHKNKVEVAVAKPKAGNKKINPFNYDPTI
jgi:hypothetical protein